MIGTSNSFLNNIWETNVKFCFIYKAHTINEHPYQFLDFFLLARCMSCTNCYIVLHEDSSTKPKFCFYLKTILRGKGRVWNIYRTLYTSCEVGSEFNWYLALHAMYKQTGLNNSFTTLRGEYSSVQVPAQRLVNNTYMKEFCLFYDDIDKRQHVKDSVWNATQRDFTLLERTWKCVSF